MRTAGIISFAIGAILFLVQEFTGWGLYQVALIFASQNELIFVAPLLMWTGAILLIVAGAVMFFVGKRKENTSLSSRPHGAK